MLQFLVAEPHQRFERDLIAEPVIVAQLQDLGVDEALDQPEDVGVGAALDLAHEALFVERQRGEGVGQGKPVGKEFVVGVETAPPDHVFLDLPAHPLGRLDSSAHTGRWWKLCSIASMVHLLFRGGAPTAASRPADAAVQYAGQPAGSMTAPPEDMTETPDPARKAEWTRYPMS